MRMYLWMCRIYTELCKNIPAKFRELLSKCSAAHPIIALGRDISASHSQDLAGMFLHYSADTSPKASSWNCDSAVFYF